MRSAVGLTIFGLCLGAAVAEGGLRMLTEPPEIIRDADIRERWTRFSDHPYHPAAGRAGHESTRRRSEYPYVESIRHNSYGYRTHEFPQRKGPNDYFVVCLGASTVYGASESNDTTWPAQLERKLASKYPHLNVKVFNLGIDGGATPSDIATLSLVGVHLRPDLVIVYTGINDEAAISTAAFRTDYGHFYRHLNLERAFHPLFLALPDSLLESRLVVFALDRLGWVLRNDLLSLLVQPQDMSDANLERGTSILLQNLRTVQSIATGAGAQVLFSTLQFRDQPAPYADDMRQFFIAHGFHFVDQDQLIADHDPTINFDEVHFTTKGDAMMADNFLAKIVADGFVERRAALDEPVVLPF